VFHDEQLLMQGLETTLGFNFPYQIKSHESSKHSKSRPLALKCTPAALLSSRVMISERICLRMKLEKHSQMCGHHEQFVIIAAETLTVKVNRDGSDPTRQPPFKLHVKESGIDFSRGKLDN
jgi:hypothetical protein